jgi:tetratricopeptide (TPR) repeat protein
MSGLARVLLIHPDLSRRDPARALVLAERAVELSHEPGPIALDTLAAAYASAGRFDEAVDVAARALKLATASGDPDAGLLAQRLRRLEQLRAGSQPGERHRAPLRMREPRSGPL